MITVLFLELCRIVDDLCWIFPAADHSVLNFFALCNAIEISLEKSFAAVCFVYAVHIGIRKEVVHVLCMEIWKAVPIKVVHEHFTGSSFICCFVSNHLIDCNLDVIVGLLVELLVNFSILGICRVLQGIVCKIF